MVYKWIIDNSQNKMNLKIPIVGRLCKYGLKMEYYALVTKHDLKLYQKCEWISQISNRIKEPIHKGTCTAVLK
jgi:hypothetical protein